MQFKSPLPGDARSNHTYSPYPQEQPSISPQQRQVTGFQQQMLPTPPQPGRKVKKRWIVLASVGFIILLQLLVYVGFQTTSSSNSIINATRPVPVLTAQPTALIAKAGPIILGGDIGAFIAKYGQPGSNSQPANGIYVFALYGKIHKNNLSVTTERGRAFYILLQAPTEQGWDRAHAIKACLAFAPLEKVYKRSMTLDNSNGKPIAYQLVYISEALAPLFPASSFTDENGKQTSAGTFGLLLNDAIGTTSRFSSCAIQIGIQGTASGA
jgi:hypothetical protein